MNKKEAWEKYAGQFKLLSVTERGCMLDGFEHGWDAALAATPGNSQSAAIKIGRYTIYESPMPDKIGIGNDAQEDGHFDLHGFEAVVHKYFMERF